MTQHWLLVLGVIYVLVTLFAPRGLVGLVVDLRQRRARAMTALAVDDVSKNFGGVAALAGVSLEIGVGRAPRAARPQRRRQDHAVSCHLGQRHAVAGPDHAVRPRHHAAAARPARAARPRAHLPDHQSVSAPDGARQRPAGGRRRERARHCSSLGRCRAIAACDDAGASPAGSMGPGGHGAARGAQPFLWRAAPARARAGARRRAEASLARRADRRPVAGRDAPRRRDGAASCRAT